MRTVLMQAVRRASVVAALALLAACSGSSDPATIVGQARELIAQGKSGEAHIALKKLLDKHADTSEARVLLARIALDNGDVRAADQELAALRSDQLQQPEALAVRCWVDLGLGEYEKVQKTLQTMTVPLDEVERLRLLAVAARASGTGADVLPQLRAALAKDPNNSLLVVELATTLSAIGNMPQAETELTELLKQQPRDPDALEARGELRLRQGAVPKAIEDLEAALAAAPPSWPLVKRVTTELLLGDAAMTAQDVGKAKERLASLQKRYPGALGTQLLSARLALTEGRAGDAVDTLQKISDALPADARVQSMLIEALLRSGNRARATALLERRVQQDPTDLRSRQVLAELLMQQARPDRVVELLEGAQDSAVESEPNEDSLLANARSIQDRAGSAIPQLQEQLAKDSGNEQVRADLAAAYLLNGQANRGLTVINEARDPKRPATVATKLALNLALANDREANQQVGDLVSASDTSAATLIAAADAAQRAGRMEMVDRLVDRALVLEPNNPEALMRRANADFLSHNYERASTSLEKLVQISPQDPRPRIAIARLSEAKGDVAGARSALQGAIKSNASAYDAALMLASLELRANQTQAALDVLDAMIAAAPKDGAAANAAGALLLRTRHIEEARARFGQATEQGAESARYWFNLGRSQLLANDRAAAALSLQRAAKLQPEWVDASIAAIRVTFDLNQREAASELAQKLVERLPKEPKAWLIFGDAKLAMQQPAEAAAAFAKAYALQPSAIAATREHVARANARAARPDQPLLAWLAREPNDLVVRRRLADHYQRTGAAKQATEQFDIIVKAAPNDVTSLNNLAWLLADSDTKRAEALARRATAIAPKQGAIADTLGWILIKAGKYQEAVQVLKSASEALPNERSIGYHYALASARAGDKETARKTLQVVLTDNSAFDGKEDAVQLSQELGS